MLVVGLSFAAGLRAILRQDPDVVMVGEIRDAETRIKVFISYSRADKAFANELVLGLAACGFAPYIDRQDIAPGEDWEKRLAGLISEADSIVYIASPDSLASENCALELRQAIALRKRILPVVWRPIDDAQALVLGGQLLGAGGALALARQLQAGRGLPGLGVLDALQKIGRAHV